MNEKHAGYRGIFKEHPTRRCGIRVAADVPKLNESIRWPFSYMLWEKCMTTVGAQEHAVDDQQFSACELRRDVRLAECTSKICFARRPLQRNTTCGIIYFVTCRLLSAAYSHPVVRETIGYEMRITFTSTLHPMVGRGRNSVPPASCR